MKSTRIKRLKTLQHLARKHSAVINLGYSERGWSGAFLLPNGDCILIKVGGTFNEMLQALHTKVRCELTPNR
jgi:hypothetical protein